jgi:hypothetical protein
MPFTISHAAAVIPIKKYIFKKSLLSALIVGAFICDLAYFVPKELSQSFERDFSHSFKGLFLFCLPFGLFSFYFFHLWVKVPLIEFFEGQFQGALHSYKSNTELLNLKSFCLVSVCILVGSTTHIFWDSLTHSNTWVNNLLPFMGESLFQFGVISVFPSQILQQLSSVLGLFYVGWHVYLYVNVHPLITWSSFLHYDKMRWIFACSAFVIYFKALIVVVIANFPQYDIVFFQVQFLDGLFESFSGTFIVFGVYALLWRLAKSRALI